jgi:hypothetical protein
VKNIAKARDNGLLFLIVRFPSNSGLRGGSTAARHLPKPNAARSGPALAKQQIEAPPVSRLVSCSRPANDRFVAKKMDLAAGRANYSVAANQGAITFCTFFWKFVGHRFRRLGIYVRAL